MIKFYDSKYERFVFYVNIDGVKKKISFDSTVGSSNGSKNGAYCTKDEKIQAAIESSKHFGKYKKAPIWLSRCIEEEEVKAVEPLEEREEKKKVFEEVTTLNQAIDVMTKEFDCKVVQVNTRPKLLKKAQTLGVEFPNLKE